MNSGDRKFIMLYTSIYVCKIETTHVGVLFRLNIKHYSLYWYLAMSI